MLRLVAVVALVSAVVLARNGPGQLTPAGGNSATAAPLVALTVDGKQRFQRIDGFGVNANPKHWNDGQLAPAIDTLVDDFGATIWRVDIFGKSNWEAVNDDADPNTFNWSYYDALYQAPDFRELWGTLAYLNRKGVQVIFSASGVVPDWMGGTTVAPGAEDEWVEMLASAVCYARNACGAHNPQPVQFTMLSPLNETDQGPPEGPKVGAAQYARLIRKLVLRLEALGQGDIRIIAPEPAYEDLSYVSVLAGDATVMAHIDHFAYHDYRGQCCSGLRDLLSQPAAGGRNYWMTEWSDATTDGSLDGGQRVKDEWAFAQVMTDNLLNHLERGASAALAWDAYDNEHEHDPSGAITHWGLLAYDPVRGTYTPKKRAYTVAQFYRFVPPNAWRIGVSSTDSSVESLAFFDEATGRVSIVGRNAGRQPTQLSGSLANLPLPATLQLLVTTSATNMQRGQDVSVAGGTFSTEVPADSFFTLTGIASPIQPAATATQSPDQAPLPPEVPTAGQVVTFDDLPGGNRVLDGQYPAGVVDWGAGAWYLASPWMAFSTNSISFNGPGLMEARFKLLNPSQLVSVSAYNGGPAPATVTLSCAGQPTVQTTLAPALPRPTVIQTGWTGPCPEVTVATSNGWDTNFDDFLVAPPASPPATHAAAPSETPQTDPAPDATAVLLVTAGPDSPALAGTP
jgi:O-glycosyl hydrolase